MQCTVHYVLNKFLLFWYLCVSFVYQTFLKYDTKSFTSSLPSIINSFLSSLSSLSSIINSFLSLLSQIHSLASGVAASLRRPFAGGKHRKSRTRTFSHRRRNWRTIHEQSKYYWQLLEDEQNVGSKQCGWMVRLDIGWGWYSMRAVLWRWMNVINFGLGLCGGRKAGMSRENGFNLLQLIV